MIYWIRRILWGGCDHKWKILAKGAITNQGVKCGSYYDLQCEKCGNVKARNLCA